MGRNKLNVRVAIIFILLNSMFPIRTGYRYWGKATVHVFVDRHYRLLFIVQPFQPHKTVDNGSKKKVARQIEKEKMRFLALMFLIVIGVVAAAITKDGDVLVLDDTNFLEATSAHNSILVEFYAPWCKSYWSDTY